MQEDKRIKVNGPVMVCTRNKDWFFGEFRGLNCHIPYPNGR